MKNNINDYFKICIDIELVELINSNDIDKELQTSLNDAILRYSGEAKTDFSHLNKRIKQLRRINRYNAVMHLLIQNSFKWWNPSLTELKACIYQFYQYMACGHYDKQTFAPFKLDNGDYDFEGVEEYRQNYLNQGRLL